MNVVQTVIDRQLGLYSHTSYDAALRRLAVAPADSFYALSNTAGGALEQDPPMFACRFAETPGREHWLALANEDGRVALQDTSVVRNNVTLESFQCHNNAVFDLAWRPGHMSFVTVSGDHTASLWDVGSGSPRCAVVCCSHTRSVKTLAFRRAPDVFATGARDGHILLWDLRAAAAPAATLTRPDNCLSSCHSSFAPKTPGSHSKRARAEPLRATSITGLVFQDDQTLISCGECDGNIKVWDLRKNYNVYKREPLPKHSIPYGGSSTRNGYTNLIIDEASRRLYASCMDNVIYCFNVSTYHATPEQRYIGHENGTFYIKTGLSADRKYLVSGSSDKNAYVWNVKRSQPVVRLAGHRAEVTCAAWCQAAAGAAHLVTCSDDARHKIWRIGKEFLDREEERELEGRAEPVPRAEIASLPRWGALDGTPKSLKRKRDPTPGSCGAKRANAPNAVGRKSKRCLADMLGACPVDESAKRCRPDAEPRAARPDPDFTYFLPKPGPSCAPPTESQWTAKTPVSVSSRDSCAPVKVSPESPKVRIVTIKTPTKNLPNFVLNGEAPHLRLMSPVKKREHPTDWLTKLRAARPAPTPATAPAPAAPAPPAPAAETPKVTRHKLGPKSTTLLKYFNIATKTK